MSSSFFATTADAISPPSQGSRLDYLDATRAFALVLGVVFHASLSFLPYFISWAVQDISTSPLVGIFFTVSHSFRMETFFLLAGFFACVALHRKGARAFVLSRALRLAVPFVVGWFLLRPLLVSGWTIGFASMRGDFDFWVGIQEGVRSLKNLPTGIFTQTHLWFLYYLAMITALTLLLRLGLKATGRWYAGIMQRADAAAMCLANSAFGLPVLVVPTAVTLWFMHLWGVDTPDQTLRPQLPVILVYGGSFILGWMFGRQPDALCGFARLSLSRWITAGAGIVATLLLVQIQLDPGNPHYAAAHVGYVVSYATMMWSLVPLTIGLFKKFCHRPRARVRYIADSSYWMYLIHLPIVVWLQVAVAEVSLHWTLKLAIICTATIGVSLLSYDLIVRSTLIGWVLNGRRREGVIISWLRRIFPGSFRVTSRPRIQAS